MCTLTWFQDRGGYQLFFNRDERFTRKPAIAPAIWEQHGVKYVAPIDGDAGGSWIAVNAAGLSLCLVNRYDAAADPDAGGRTSRGLLLTSLVHHLERDAVRASLQDTALGDYRPFTLAVFEPGRIALLADWNGRELALDERGDARMPLISAPEAHAVRPLRAELLRRLERRARGGRGASFQRFHASHEPERGPLSPCMHGLRSQTVSFSHVAVDDERVSLAYCPSAPCSGRLGPPLVLRRRPAQHRRPALAPH